MACFVEAFIAPLSWQQVGDAPMASEKNARPILQIGYARWPLFSGFKIWHEKTLSVNMQVFRYHYNNS